MRRVLIVDDDTRLAEDLRAGLAPHDFEGVTAADGAAALEAVTSSGPFDLVLLDVTMPGQSGFEVLDALRGRGVTTPVIFLTAHGRLEDRVKGLRLGADDYVVKPFELEEVIARADAVLRRGRPRRRLRVGRVEVDLDARTVERDGRDLEVSRREFDLLRVLIEAGGEVVSRAEILDQAFGMPFDPGTNVVDVVVMRLRKKLDAGGGHAIRTVVGKGYMVDATPVST